MHTKCPECNLTFTPEELHDASLEDHLEYKRMTNDVIKDLRHKLTKATEALENIRSFKLSNFMGPSDMALECVITANTALREIGE